MTWTEALEIVIAQSKHEHYRALCGDDHRHRDIWRARMVAMVTGQPVLKPVDAILAEARAEGIPERIEPRRGCCGQ